MTTTYFSVAITAGRQDPDGFSQGQRRCCSAHCDASAQPGGQKDKAPEGTLRSQQ